MHIITHTHTHTHTHTLQYSEFHVFTKQSLVENCYNMGYNCSNE